MRNKLLIAIILLTAFLRFYKLGSTPPGLYWDEVSLGYNAYSILETARDEHNQFLPISSFKAFGDYKPPGYIYSVVPSIAIFGLNNFAVRLPSALAGVLMIFMTYLLVKELFPNKKWLPELASLLLAISPWSLQISRVAFEANLAALFNLLAIYLFIKSLKKPYLLSASALSFIAAFYTFNANRLLSVLIVLLLAIIYAKHLYQNKKHTILAALLGIALLIPLAPHLTSSQGKLRWNEVNIFSDLNVILDSNARIAQDGGSRLARLTHHRYIGHTINFLDHYFDHFKGRYLFLTGDINPRFSIQDVGQLYLVNLPFLLIGLYALFQIKSKKVTWLILAWFLLGPVPAATARETPHALRSLSTLPTPHILIALGFVYVYNNINKYKTLLLAFYSLLLIMSLSYFQYSYYHYAPREFAGEWLTSYPRLINFLNSNPQSQQAKTITVVPDLGRPYIYFLFYNQFDPANYQRSVDRTGDVFGFFTVHGFDKYRFERIEPESPNPGDIYVVRVSELLDGFESLAIITETNGVEQFRVLKKL